MNLVLLHPSDELTGGMVTLADARAAHLRTVLRVVTGQRVRIGMLDGPLGTGTVRSIDDERVALSCEFDGDVPPRPAIDLLLAVPRPKVMRRLWAQLAALGVARIMLTNAERVERPYFDSHVLEEATYRALLVEGLQQAGDTRLPQVSIHRQFKILVEDHLDVLAGPGLRLLAHPAVERSIAGAVAAAPRAHPRCLLAVGPEGGWNAFELSLLQAHGFETVGLGTRTLRVDTACTALLAILHAALHERDRS